MIATSFPYIDYLPKPGQARGIQIDIKPEKIGLRYPVEIGLVGDSKLILSALLPLVNQKDDLEFLKSKQKAMKNWNRLLEEKSTRTDKPIDWAKFAEACGGKGYAVRELSEIKFKIHQAMKEERKPTIIEAYVDPFEPKVEMSFVRNLAESFARRQPFARRIGLTLYRDKVHEVLKNIHTHSL